ncbi:MAG: trimethylamine methyltransferase family protein [Desulfosarcinaceae bacterium]|nr:trimethylamine methyltransferase family protein [Desulfosarcinaceae bacterium]
MEMVQPTLTVLRPEQMDQVHRFSLAILEDTGLRVDDPDARRRFAGAGCRVADGERRVYIPAEVVNWALAQAPGSVSIHDRQGAPRFHLGDTRSNITRFGVGVTNLYYQEPADDQVRPFTLADVAAASRLADHLPAFDLLSTPGIAQDLPTETADLWATLTMTANTVKPLVLLISDERMFTAALDLLEFLHGELSRKPWVIPYVNPISPLVLGRETTRKTVMAVERGLPLIYNNYGMSGATTPISPGGTLALLNAELLAGVVFSQLVKAGAPIIAGSLPAGFDMQAMTSVYTPHSMLLNLACAEMMAHYGLPHSGTSGCVNGWGADLQLAGTLWMNHLTACMGKVGMAPFVGGTFDSLAFAPTVVVYADQVIRQARQFSGGFSLAATDVATEQIDTIGPAGNFLMAPLTLERFRQAQSADLWPSQTLEQWAAEEGPSADGHLRRHTIDLMVELRPPSDHDEIMARGETLIHPYETAQGS